MPSLFEAFAKGGGISLTKKKMAGIIVSDIPSTRSRVSSFPLISHEYRLTQPLLEIKGKK
jgi:hypothetical protein